MYDAVTEIFLTDDDSVLAGEAALGLLDPAQQAVFAARIATDARFAAEVTAWEARFQPWLGRADAAVPPALWPKIRAKLQTAATRRPANAPLRLWQAAAGAATAVAATLAFMLVNPPTRHTPVPPPQPMLVAALGSETGRAVMTVAYDLPRGELLVTPVKLNPDSRFPELWVIGTSGEARSLGLVEAKRATRVQVPLALRRLIASGATLAVTLEPKGGAPYDKATGPVIVSGKIETL